MKEFDNIRYRRMKKVLMSHDDQISINTSNSSVPMETNEMLMLDMDSSNQNPILDDDDSRSADFISDMNQIYPSDEASLNSSQSSLQHPSSTPLNSLLIGRQISTTSQPIQSQMISNINNINRRFSAMEMNDTNQMNLLTPLPPLQISIDNSDIPIRADVRIEKDRICITEIIFQYSFLVHHVGHFIYSSTTSSTSFPSKSIFYNQNLPHCYTRTTRT